VCANVSITTLRVLGVAVNNPRSVMIAVLGFNLAGDGSAMRLIRGSVRRDSAISVGLLALVVCASAACRRENPALLRAATTATVVAASQHATAVVARATAVVDATLESGSFRS
jgi:hypothetical protein